MWTVDAPPTPFDGDVPVAPDTPAGSIPEWLLGKLVDVIVAGLNLLPAGPDGSGITGGAGNAITTLVGHAASIGSWVPWSAFGTAAAFVAVGLALSFTIKFARIVLSFFTVGGGSAG